MKRLLLGLFLIASVSTVFGQQDPQFTQNYFNRLFWNPAYAGSTGNICATLVGRQQWVGFDGKPESYMFSGHVAFKDPLLGWKHGAGLSVLSDKLGQEQTLNVKLHYALHKNLGTGVLSGGLSLGMIQKTLGSDWEAVDDFQSDPSIPDNGAQDLGFDMDFGLYYRIPNKMFVGVSMTHITGSELSASEEQTRNQPGDAPINFGYGVARHIYVMGGYEHTLSSDWVLKPNAFVRTDLVSATFDLGAIVEYKQKFWGGLNYRLLDAVSPMAGVNLPMPGTGIGGGNLRIGYSYDVTTSQIRKYSSGSHEILVSYCFGLTPKVNVQRHGTVRFL